MLALAAWVGWQSLAYPIMDEARPLTRSEYEWFVDQEMSSNVESLNDGPCNRLNLGSVCQAHYQASLDVDRRAKLLSRSSETPQPAQPGPAAAAQEDNKIAKLRPGEEAPGGRYKGPETNFAYDTAKEQALSSSMRALVRQWYPSCVDDARKSARLSVTIPTLKTLVADAYKAKANCYHKSAAAVLALVEYQVPTETEEAFFPGSTSLAGKHQ
jgi:hypothetical protein